MAINQSKTTCSRLQDIFQDQGEIKTGWKFVPVGLGADGKSFLTPVLRSMFGQEYCLSIKDGVESFEKGDA